MKGKLHVNRDRIEAFQSLKESFFLKIHLLLFVSFQDFVRHFKRFVEQNRDFDERLGTVLNLAFHHSQNLNSAFKVKYLQAFCKKIK